MKTILVYLLIIVNFSFYSHKAWADTGVFHQAYRNTKKQPKIFHQLNAKSTPVASKGKMTSPTSNSSVKLINLNTAEVETLLTLPRIGRKRAEAIIDYRDQLPQQRFTSIDQLLAIKGISHKLLDHLRAYLILD